VERTTGVGGVFIRSTRPDALRAWYAEHFGLESGRCSRATPTTSGGSRPQVSDGL
jgi:hypothetical protein